MAMLAAMASRRNSAVKIYLNGSTADSLYGLSKRVGERVSRVSSASQRAQVSLARKVQPVAKAAIRKVYNIGSSLLNDKLKLETGKRNNSDYLSLWASTRKVSLIEFGGRWGGPSTPGATASILLGTSKTYDSAFIANIGWRGASGASAKADTVSRGIYVRKQGPGGKRVGRGPVKRLYGPSVFEMITTSPKAHSAETVSSTIVPQLQSYYVTELARQLALELRRG
jgi:hypothetical protein